MRIGLDQPAEHNADHADVKPSFGVGGLDFIMAHEPAMLHKPAKGPFHDPAFGQGREAASGFVSRHDLQAQRPRLAMRSHPGGEIVPAVALVRPETAQPPKTTQRLIQKAASTASFGHIGPSDTDRQQQAQSVHQDMSFDPLGFLGRIIATPPRLVPRADGLAIQNGCGRFVSFVGLRSDFTAQHIMNDLPTTLPAPQPEIVINGFPRTKVTGQQPPGTARPDKIKQRVANPPQIGRWATAPPCWLSRRQKQLQQVPLFIAQISRIQRVLHPASLAGTLGQRLSNPLKNDFSDALLASIQSESRSPGTIAPKPMKQSSGSPTNSPR